MFSPDVSPAPTCARCHKEIPAGQRVEHRGALYCMECTGRALNGDASAAKAHHSPAAAVILSLLPGLGQMYNRQPFKGILVLGAFLILALGEGPFGDGSLNTAALVVLYFWNLFDAYWTAERVNRSPQPPVQWAYPAYQEQAGSAAAVAWGWLLIILGVLFVLNNFGVTWLTFDRLWPAALFTLGIWLLISFAVSRSRPANTQPAAPEGSPASQSPPRDQPPLPKPDSEEKPARVGAAPGLGPSAPESPSQEAHHD